MKFTLPMVTAALALLCTVPQMTQAQTELQPLEGQWDLVINENGKEVPSWLEIRHSGLHTLVGRFVHTGGSARPISEIRTEGTHFSFEIPPQWEPETTHMEVSGDLKGNALQGTIKYSNGKSYSWSGVRKPALPYEEHPVWGAPVALLSGKDLTGWHTTGDENQWLVENGVLKSPKPGSNLVTDDTYTDFKLHVEFRYPEDGNSGVYLRGRYEVQVADSKGMAPSSEFFGGIYGFLTPNQMVAGDAGEWQAFDITLIGNRVSIVANGMAIITDQSIPGITGGALDSKEGEPGPILLQGDHHAIEYRNIVITPRMDAGN